MKKLILLPLCALMVLFVSCSDDTLPTPSTPVEDAYKGELFVGDFTKEVVIDIKKNTLAGVMDIIISKASFAANMPVELDITLKDIPYTTDGGEAFAAENVAPYIGTKDTPSPAYMFATVEGSIKNNKLFFSAKMAEGLAPYLAGKDFVFEGEEVTE